jgi:N4-gp56 family major capsid protein
MATTNFTRLTTQQLQVWSREIWQAARDWSFVNNFVGNGTNAMIQRISELKQTKNGARCVITLVPDIVGDGVVGDSQLEGNEAELKAADQVIQLDQLRNANRNEGRMADQRTVVVFREQSKNKLAYWLGDRIDQMAFLTLSGVSYSFTNNGAPRVGSQLPFIEFAGDVTAPSATRHFRWSQNTSGNTENGQLLAADTTEIQDTDLPSWAMIVNMKAAAVSNYIRPLRGDGGYAYYNVFMTPQGIAALKLDPLFLTAWRHAMERGEANPLFKGTKQGGTKGIMIDGINILEYRHVYNTTGAASGSKWGSSGTQDGQRVLLCGAQAMGFGDIGLPEWDEKDFDYGNSPGISIAKILGMKKPVFPSVLTGTQEDFGVMCVDTAIPTISPID